MKKAIVVIIIFLGLLPVGCGKKQSVPAGLSEPIPVRVTSPTVREIAELLVLNGTAESLRSVEVFADVAGKVIEKPAQLGKRVQKGETLARLVQDVPGMVFSPVSVEAPISGVVLGDFAEVGSRLTPQRACFSIGVIDTILIKARLLESDFSRVKIGAFCKVTADALPDATFNGRLRKIAPIIDSRSRTAVAEIILPNSGGRVLPGMAVKCEFAVGSRSALTVPLDAVTRLDADYRLVKVVDGRAQFATVTGGAILDGEMEVMGDLSAKDLVVVYGQNLLQDGSPVKIVE